MSISSTGILLGLKSWFVRSAPNPVPESGWRHLSLPRAMAPLDNPLYGWEMLSCGEPADASVPDQSTVPIPDDMVTDPGVSEYRLQLSGYLDRGIDSLYCFYDTENRRWFRLSCGQYDSASGVKLERTPAGPLVVDTCYARTYLIDSRGDRLIRLDEPGEEYATE